MGASVTQLRAPTGRKQAPDLAIRLDRLILAIGEPHFDQVLFETFKALAGADRCLVFESAGEDMTCIADAGVSAKASRERVLQHLEDAPSLSGGRNIARRRVARALGVADLFAFRASASRRAAAGRRACTLFVLRERNGLFTAEEFSALTTSADIIGAAVLKDRQKLENPFERDDGVVSKVILGSADFNCLGNREKSVCIGIVTGHTTEAIALHLGISPNSVLTFRRRLYHKLGITSQNELFMRVLETAKSL